MIRARILTAAIALTTAIACTSFSQDTLTPKWAKNAINVTNMKYSANGAVLMGSESTAVRAWRVSDNMMLASVPVAATDFLPLPNGTGFYYSVNGSPNSIYRYEFASRSSTLFRTDATNFGAASTLALSTDNTKLAYTTYNYTTSRTTITMVDVATKAVLKRFALPNAVYNYDLEFVHGNSRLLTSGLRLYNLDGTLAGSRLSATTNYFAVSPDRTKAYARDEAAVLFAVDLTAATGLPALWSKGNHWFVDQNLQVSADGNAFVTNGWTDDSRWNCVFAYSTSDGQRLSNAMLTAEDAYNGNYATSPTVNEIIVFNISGTPKFMRFAFDTTTGANTRLQDLSEGVAGSTIQTFKIGGVQLFATEDNYYGTTVIRRVEDGVKVSAIAKNAVVFSPDGSHYIWVGYRETDNAYGAHVYRTSDNLRRASYTQTDVTAAGWGSSSRIWVMRGNASPVKARIADFTGSALTLVREFSGVMNTYGNLVSPNGSRYVNWAGNKAVIYNVATGDTVGTIEADMSYSALLFATFVENDLALHEWIWDGGTVYTSRIRILKVDEPPFLQLKTFAHARNTQPYDYGKVAIAPDRSFAVFMGGETPGADGIAPTTLNVVRGGDNVSLKNYIGQFNEPSPLQCMALSEDRATLIYGTAYARLLIAVDMPTVLANLEVAPMSVIGGHNATGTVTISRPAPTGGVVVQLDGEAGLSLPTDITVPAGSTSATFTIGTSGVDSSAERDLTATLFGYSKHASLTVTPPTELLITFNPASVLGGNPSTGTITLNGNAGPGGATVALTSSHTFVSVPSSVTVPAGQTTTTFTATTSDPGATGTAQITGNFQTIAGVGTLEVRGSSVEATFDVATIKGGNALVLTVTLASPAPSGGKTFTLVGTPLLEPPATVIVPAGKSSVEIGIRTKATLTDELQTLTLHGDFGPVAEAEATVQAPQLSLVKPSHTSVTGAITVTALLVLDGPAPAGLTFNCTSNNTAATLPASITFIEGRQFYSLNVACKRVLAHKLVTITIGGKSFQLRLRAAQ